jgi:hypothetical protein
MNKEKYRGWTIIMTSLGSMGNTKLYQAEARKGISSVEVALEVPASEMFPKDKLRSMIRGVIKQTEGGDK